VELTKNSKEAIQIPAAKKKAATKKKSEDKKTEASDDQQKSNPEEANPEETEPGETGQQAEGLEYQPSHPSLENAGLDQHAAEDERQAQLAEQRDDHNVRTGDASR
jgi:hypothetical protein